MPEVTNPQPKVETPAPPRAPVKKTGARKKKLVKRLVALGVAAAILGGGGFALYKFLNSGSGDQGEIYAQPASLGTIQSKVSGSGTAKAKESAAITLTQSGTVQEVYVTAGQTVMAGDPLYTIYSQAAEDEVSNARKKLEDLQKDMADLQEEASNLTVRAPFAGKLQEVQDFDLDQDVSKGTTVATLVNDRKLKLSLYFSYAYENDIQAGQSVSVSIPAVMGSFTGTVEAVHKVSYISPEGAVHFEAVIVFDNPGTLTAGMDASAVLKAADGADIYPYENGKTEFYETRTIVAKASGPVTGEGNLLNYANVSAGEALLYLGSSTIDTDIRNKQEEIDEAQERLDEAVKALEDFNAVAPIDGTVTSCTLSEGAEVKSGDTVVIISNTTTMLVTIQVDDRNISFIKPGDMVELDWNGNPYMGAVTAIDMGGAQSGQGMTNYPVTLSVDNFDGSLMDGAWLQYSFVTSESADCILVPTSSVKYVSDLEGNRQAVVFVQREERPDDVPELDLPTVEPGQKRQYPSEAEGYYPVIVETGISDAQNVEITSGIQEGDMVFVNYTVTDMGSSW
ncbi:efflux RND transporter periplasmic adaptor subunit [Pseudoflavonifractor phocaeensis]|uniref:efflux RND transporter periplasmic adaptor subunit n=1 Tax=Pseudoflavonifractor phocaeensis TaxID=1870988 RepID=UPI001F2EA6BA|nr:HlyD family efflux transporter periplasmic adaptor subunit [Pseudoflavonifractor phocaeensis]MCF2661617.1 HlyD family efflux transporter periplasmic adaptor subunit [Pseudoflavonifractor phocaeensis]